jgi:enoyl-CoA hydratase/carnithine racemase
MPAASPGAVRVRIEPRAGSGDIATVRIDRPEKLNALGAALFESFAHAIAELGVSSQ